MESRPPAESTLLQDKTFLLLLFAVTLAFAWILWPFYATVFWAIVFAIVFTPLYRRLCGWMAQRRTLAALTTLIAIIVIVILPAAVITVLLLQEGFSVYERIQSGELDFGRYFQQVLDALPRWVTGLMDRFELKTLADVRDRLSAALMKGVQFVASHVVSVGQLTFDFVVGFFIMLYLLFFLLRDGAEITRRVRAAIPLQEELERELFDKFVTVIRATIKGNIVVAILQGALGGLIFWFLGIRSPVFWAVLMAFLSLLPAIGTALVWLPVAIYFLVAGEIWQGLLLIAYGVLVIGMVDNVVRPILVGKDTQMPDYLVLISTLGGMAIFGLNGFVIGPVIAAMFIAVWGTVAAASTEDRRYPVATTPDVTLSQRAEQRSEGPSLPAQ